MDTRLVLDIITGYPIPPQCNAQVHVEAQLNLPPCTWVDREVVLSPLERHIYEEQSSKLMRSLEGLGGIENTLTIYGSADLPPTTKQAGGSLK